MKLLFSAPIDFDEKVMDEYRAAFDLTDDDPDIWVCNPLGGLIDGAALDEHPHLMVLATPSTGTNHIDLEACKKRGIKVISLLDDYPALLTISASAEFTFHMIITALRLGRPRELFGRTVGIIGYGRIGRRVSGWVKDFGGDVLVHDPKFLPITSPIRKIFRQCDVVVICCALTPQTTGMITGQLIESMKPHGRLVNTARGEVLDEPDVKRALENRPDIRVALDVLTGETTGTADPDWFMERGHIVTPHIAGNTWDSRTKAARIILGLLKKELEYERQQAEAV